MRQGKGGRREEGRARRGRVKFDDYNISSREEKLQYQITSPVPCIVTDDKIQENKFFTKVVRR